MFFEVDKMWRLHHRLGIWQMVRFFRQTNSRG